MVQEIRAVNFGGSKSLNIVAKKTTAKTDGRKQRSVRSREKIKQSITDLIRAGNFSPRAVDISEHSGLSMRTVFRHIDDMESLNREISEDLQKNVLPRFLKPFSSMDWREQLDEAMERRAEIFEIIMPIRIAASLHRFRSASIMREYDAAFGLERASLLPILPDNISGDKTLVEALNQVMGVSAWVNLRMEQGLSVSDTAAIVRRSVQALLRDTGA